MLLLGCHLLTCWMIGTSALGPSDVQIENVQSWFVDNFLDGETQIFGGPNKALKALGSVLQVCDGGPSLITRSSTVKPNGACPELFTAMNASCTCLSGFDNNDAWEFHVQSKGSNDTTTGYPTVQKSTDILEIDAIQTLYVPEALQKLSIIGIGDSPLSLTFLPEYRNQASDELPIARTLDSTSNLATIELVNIDMFATAKRVSAFMPSSATSVTLRHCNITSFGFEFTLGLNNLTQLDLSSNNLVTAYAGTGNQHLVDRCSLTFCELEEYNLSYNKLTVLPTTPLSLETLQKFYIQGNDISNFIVNSTTFELVKGLADFKADSPNNSSLCSAGQWEIAHGTNFCVTDSGSLSTSDNSPSGTNPLMFVLFAGVVVVILLMYVLAWQWLNYRKARPSEAFSRASSHDLYSIFNPDSEDHETMRVRLATDPLIVTNRLDYGEVKLGRCINRGGFGLIFTGTYRNRPVAIKKIRVNKDAEADQIEQFIREIALMAILRHPRIVEFIGVAWEAIVDLSAVTELMVRGDLSHVLRENGYQLTWANHKATIALHIVEALAYLHSLSPKVIHRDLKSKNVLLNEEMEAKLIDFGISRERNEIESHMTTGMGTSFWIAPEVLSGQDYNEKADVFSFGVVLSELDTNDYPYWNAANPPRGMLQQGEILLLVAAGQIRPSFSAGCPASILGVANRCLQVRPQDRPSAEELVQVFREVLQVLGPPKRPPC